MGNTYFEYIQHIPLTILNIIISFIILRIAYHRRAEIRGGQIFIALIGLIILRAIIIIPTYANANPDNIIYWQNVQWPLNAIIVTVWFVFTLSYIQAFIIPPFIAVFLSIVPATIAIVIYFDDQLAWIRSGYQVVIERGLPRLVTTPGPLYNPFTVYMYVIAIIAILIMFRYFLSSPGRYRQQLVAAVVTFLLALTVYMIQSDSNIHPLLSAQIIIFIVQFIIILGVLRNGFLQFPFSSRPLLMK